MSSSPAPSFSEFYISLLPVYTDQTIAAYQGLTWLKLPVLSIPELKVSYTTHSDPETDAVLDAKSFGIASIADSGFTVNPLRGDDASVQHMINVVCPDGLQGISYGLKVIFPRVVGTSGGTPRQEFSRAKFASNFRGGDVISDGKITLDFQCLPQQIPQAILET